MPSDTLRRQPWIGRELNRRLAAADLTERRVECVPILSLDYDELVTYGLDLPQAVAALGDGGRLARERAQQVVDDLVAASAEGTFCAFGGYLLARGRVPSAAPPR